MVCLKVILCAVVAFAVVCALIMVFNISVPNELRGFLFYIQVIGFVYDYISSDITWVTHTLPAVEAASRVNFCLLLTWCIGLLSFQCVWVHPLHSPLPVPWL